MHVQGTLSADEWIALCSLLFSIVVASAGVAWSVSNIKTQILNKLAEDKESIDAELLAFRMSAYEEFKTLRSESGEYYDTMRREIGESLAAVREKINQVELWIRDELGRTRHTLTGSMDQRFTLLHEKIEGVDDRVRVIEIRLGPGDKPLPD